jgi:hypothetical protein
MEPAGLIAMAKMVFPEQRGWKQPKKEKSGWTAFVPPGVAGWGRENG